MSEIFATFAVGWLKNSKHRLSKSEFIFIVHHCFKSLIKRRDPWCCYSFCGKKSWWFISFVSFLRSRSFSAPHKEMVVTIIHNVQMSVVKNSRSWPLKKNRWKELAPLLSNQTNRKKCVKRIFFLDYFQFLYAILSDMVKYFRSSVNPLTLRLKSNFPPDIYLVPIQ